MNRKTTLTALLAGLLFGVGLAVSGMVKPEKLAGFLDIAGDWDPSLLFVMLGATAVHALFVPFILKRPRPVFAERFSLPTRKDIDARLLGGAAIFGVGWALGGLCPGPALVGLASGSWVALAFVAAMTAGMLAARLLDPPTERPAGAVEEPAPRRIV